MNKTIEFTQEELIALDELVKDTVAETVTESDLSMWQTIREKIYKAAYYK
jgi:hypothetical protein